MIKISTLALSAPVQYKLPIAIFLVWLVPMVGMLGIYAGLESWFLTKTPFNFLLNLGLLVWCFPPRRAAAVFIWSAVFLLGMAVEIVGVRTGQPFGDYHYGNNLGIKAFGVPLLIGVNWVILTFITSVISHSLLKNRWLRILLAALMMVFLDLFIEPTAPLFDFWHWEAGAAPLQNFVAWFAVAFGLAALAYPHLGQQDRRLPLHLYASQWVFFSFFYVVYHL